ncbi:MAG: hypothetical protein F6J87_14925 [Spirulina sp. SIO3F2]|nr:hypothetical protein [Spirulina sp. SIO3F2]
MALIEAVDYEAQRIYLGADSVGLAGLDLLDVYRVVRQRRRLNESDRRFAPLIFGGGNLPKSPGRFTPAYVLLTPGTTIIPYDAPHTLRITREIFTKDGIEGLACFDRSPLTAQVDFEYNIPQVEIIVINGGSGLTAAQESHLFSLGTPQQNADALLGTELP